MAEDRNDVEKERRVSRACIACRSRKSKCELTSQEPPCRRCTHEGRECILATSRRGGRRIRKRPPQSTASTSSPSQAGYGGLRHDQALVDDPLPQIQTGSTETAHSDGQWYQSHSTQPSANVNVPGEHSQNTTRDIERHITSTDLLNPSDALELLARVADREAAEENTLPIAIYPDESPQDGSSHDMANPDPEYPPLRSGALSPSDIPRLIDHYRQNYHPYYPIAHRNVFDLHQTSRWLREEPHLVTAILTIASKDESASSSIHDACVSHIQDLICKLVFWGTSEIGAIEALLILAEWFPQRLQGAPTTGQGEEDQGTWMQVGLAVRLGYLNGLEQAGLADKALNSDEFHRKRLVWAACYMSDRQISIRLGKGFWSRGPGPGLALRAEDFPSLRSQQVGSDNLGLLFQAHLELTQLFSNAYDILYASPSHREHLVAGGEYVKYIDDFSSALRRWKLTWGSMGFTPPVRAALTLSYDFLRLYINAFAFQASINRDIARARQTSHAIPNSLFGDINNSPDARFIFESIDAANSLLGTLNGFVDATSSFKCMPLKYYLYTMHAAVFLFKAKLAGAIRIEAHDGLRRTINATIEKLQSSSVNSYGIGHRYSRSLYLLWRKLSEKLGVRRDAERPALRPSFPPGGVPADQPWAGLSDVGVDLDHLNGFSWRDLDGLGQFVGTDTSVVEGMLQSPDYDLDQGPQVGQDVNGLGWYDNSMSHNPIIL